MNDGEQMFTANTEVLKAVPLSLGRMFDARVALVEAERKVAEQRAVLAIAEANCEAKRVLHELEKGMAKFAIDFAEKFGWDPIPPAASEVVDA